MDQARRVWLWQTEGAREAPVDRGLLVVGHLVKIYIFYIPFFLVTHALHW